MADLVMNPLTLVMTAKSDADYAALQKTIKEMQKMPQSENPIRVALRKLGIVHFARFVFLGDNKLAIITTYDGSFERYVDAFIKAIGGVFDKIFAHVKDAPPLPVAKNRDAFLKYIQAHDVECVAPFFSAYPDLTVMDILTLQKSRGP